MRKLFPRSCQRVPRHAARRGKAAPGPGRALPPRPPASHRAQVRKAPGPGEQSSQRRARSSDPAAYLAGGAARLGGTLGEARAEPSPYFSRGTRGSRPASSRSRGAGPGSGSGCSDGSGGTASAQLPPPRPRRPALDPINGSGLCLGRWGRERVPGGQCRRLSSFPLTSTLGWAWGRPWGEEGSEGSLPGRDPPRGGRRGREGGSPVRSCLLGPAVSSAPVREFVHLYAVPAS